MCEEDVRCVCVFEEDVRCVCLTLRPGSPGPDGGGREVCPGHPPRGQRDGDPHEVHQEDRGEHPCWRRVRGPPPPPPPHLHPLLVFHLVGRRRKGGQTKPSLRD